MSILFDYFVVAAEAAGVLQRGTPGAQLGVRVRLHKHQRACMSVFHVLLFTSFVALQVRL